jgi:D-aminoacyl-tRNA deacylase
MTASAEGDLRMRVVIQRVLSAGVHVGGQLHAEIGRGLLVFVATEERDGDEDIRWICGKIARLRIFPDAAGKMNLSPLEVGGEVIVVSQFTLFASTKQGNRPNFLRASIPTLAIPRYEQFLQQLSFELRRPVKSGVFGADMQVSLVNDGPVTICIDSQQRE